MRCIRRDPERPELMEELYTSNTGLINFICRKYGAGLDWDDIYQECYFGFVNAVKLYDENKGSFANYLLIWLKQIVLGYRYNNGSVVRVPGYQHKQMRRYQSIVNDYQVSCGRDPTDAELMGLLQITPDELQDLKRDIIALKVRSTSEVIIDDGEITLEDTIPADNDGIEGVTDRIHHEELKLFLWGMVDDLPADESNIICKHYKEGQTLEECGAALGVSSERARQIEDKAIESLRRAPKANKLRSFLDGVAYEYGTKKQSVSAFHRTGYSSTEKAAIKLMELERRLYESGHDQDTT